VIEEINLTDIQKGKQNTEGKLKIKMIDAQT
jgi:hypothetical protein